jgi:hypothetical protein
MCWARSSSRNRGSGTSRRSCPFVGPNVITPLTGVTDSAASALRRKKSLKPEGLMITVSCRNAVAVPNGDHCVNRARPKFPITAAPVSACSLNPKRMIL